MTTPTSYLPVLSSIDVLHAVRAGDFSGLSKIGDTAVGPFERIGMDRFMAIHLDMAMSGHAPPLTMLDVGCNVGTLSALFASRGYRVTGIDNGLAGRFRAGGRADASAAWSQYMDWVGGRELGFIAADLSDWLDGCDERFDVILLLSIVHQWWSGYGGTGLEQEPPEKIWRLLSTLLGRANRAVYIENVENGNVGGNDALTWVSRLAPTGNGDDLVRIGQSVDADGDFRTLYRWNPPGGRR